MRDETAAEPERTPDPPDLGAETPSAELLATVERVAQEWRTTVDSAREVIMMIGRDYRIVRVNRPATILLERPYHELVGHDANEAVAHLLPGPDPLLLQRVRESGRPAERELCVERDGELWLQLWTDPIATADGSWDGAVCVLHDISERKRAEERLRRSLEQLHALAAHLQSVREETRATIARRIHDQLGYALTVLKLDLSSLAGEIGDRPEHRQRLGSLIALVDETIGTVRSIATELRPVVLDDFGLAAAIEWQAEEYERRTGIRTNAEAEEVELDPDRATAAFRIVQEALTNVARHAEAQRVAISLTRDSGTMTLCIEDDGRGFEASRLAASSSHGLLDMRERALLLGGELVIESEPGAGTRVSLAFPLEPTP